MNSLSFKFSCLFWMILNTAGREAVFLSFPRNEIVQVSKNVELQCSTNSSEPLRWEVTNASEPAMKTVILFIRGNFTDAGKPKYGINSSDSGQFNLIIESVDFSYAGKYRCTEGSFGSKVEAELAVIDPYPQCQTNASDTDNSIVENEYLWMQCSVDFSGNVNLRMEWIRNSTGNVIDTFDHKNQSVLVIQVNSSDNGETFIFKVTFTQENNSRETVIEWNYTVNVLYAPRNLVIYPLRNVYTVGERLECSADGNPIPSYEWTDTETNRTINGSILTIEEHKKSDQNHSFICRAHNMVAGHRENISITLTFYATGTSSISSDSFSATTVAVVTVALVCIIIFVIGLLVTCRAKVKAAWTSRCSERDAPVEPDVLHVDSMTHYYDNEQISNEARTGLAPVIRDDSVAPQIETSLCIYDVVRQEDSDTMTDSLNRLQPIGDPVYSEVNRSETASKINEDRNANNHPSSALTAQRMYYFGADGTEYAQVNSFGGASSITTTPKHPLFHRVDDYALIDHTIRALPPPPRL